MARPNDAYRHNGAQIVNQTTDILKALVINAKNEGVCTNAEPDLGPVHKK